MLRANLIRRPAQKGRILCLAVALVVVLLALGVRVEIVMKAAGIPKNSSGIGGFVNGAHALVTPALVMVGGGCADRSDRGWRGHDVRRPPGDADGRDIAWRTAAAWQRHCTDRLTVAGARHLEAAAESGTAPPRTVVTSRWHWQLPAVGAVVLVMTLAVSALDPTPARALAAGLAEPGRL